MNNISNLKVGEEQQIIVMVQKVEKETASNGNFYEKLRVCDTEGNRAIFYNWNEPFMEKLPAIISVNVETKSFKEGNNYRMLRYRLEPNIKKMAFCPKPMIDLKEYWNVLNNYAQKLPEPLHKLVGMVLMQNQKSFVTFPLTISKSFARQCGILEATVKLIKMADVAATTLGLDWNLTITAAILYYVGFVDCTNDTFLSTPEEILIGAGVSAYTKVLKQAEILKEEFTDSSFKVDVNCIEHILLSRYEGLSVAIPEAMLLRHLDAIVTDCDLMSSGLAVAESGTVMPVSGYGKLYRK